MERNILLPWGEMNIPCRVYEPDFSDVDQVLIGIHGFGGNKDSSVLRAVAEEMYFYRTATVVFDFPGFYYPLLCFPEALQSSLA